MKREDYIFRYFLNAGYDKVTNECDLEGSDVYDKDGHYLGTIKWVTPDEIEDMSDDELMELFFENDIIF